MRKITFLSIISLAAILLLFNIIGFLINEILELSTIYYNWTSQIIVAIIISFFIFISIKTFRNIWIMPLGYFLISAVLLLTSSSLTESSLIVEFLYSLVSIISLLFKPFESFLIGISIYIYILILPSFFLIFISLIYNLIRQQFNKYLIS